MPVFSTSQLNRYTLKAEAAFVNEYKCIIDRASLEVISGTSLYAIPDNIIDIRRVTYRGKKIDPLNHRDFREGFISQTATGVPKYYIFNNVGQSTIKLFPTPAETLTGQQTDLLNPNVIREECIVEFYTTSDGIGYKLPEYIRRRLLKTYVLKLAFLAEGKGQNLKASKYWDSKWEYLKELYGNQIQDQLNTPRRLMANGGQVYRGILAPPVLPISMQGIGLNPGE